MVNVRHPFVDHGCLIRALSLLWLVLELLLLAFLDLLNLVQFLLLLLLLLVELFDESEQVLRRLLRWRLLNVLSNAGVCFLLRSLNFALEKSILPGCTTLHDRFVVSCSRFSVECGSHCVFVRSCAEVLLLIIGTSPPRPTRLRLILFQLLLIEY